VKADLADFREGLGEEILLELGGEAEFFVEAEHVKVKCFVAAAEEIDFGAEGFDFGEEALPVVGFTDLGDVQGGAQS
jgi:hypothetical protein